MKRKPPKTSTVCEIHGDRCIRFLEKMRKKLAKPLGRALADSRDADLLMLYKPVKIRAKMKS